MNLDFTVLNLQADYEKCLIQYPFRFFFSLDGSAHSPASLAFNDHKDIPDYILNLIASFSEAFLIFTRECGFKSPVEEGIFHEKGARYIDVLLDDIPQQRGLVSAELIDQSDLFEEEDFLIGQSIRIVVDRNLISGTATPIHELFHVFQYNYCHFNNMWFMEGLARWAQNLTHSRPSKVEILPQDCQQLQALFRRAHDAEYFWRRLLGFVEQPVEFVRKLLLECEFQCRVIELKSANSKTHQKNAWTREEKRSRHNNIIIAKALMHVAKNTVVNELPELVNFIQSLEKYSSERSSELTVEGDIELKTVADLIQFQHVEEVQGNLTISVPDLCSLGGFSQLEVVTGTLSITECSSLEEIVGFNQLRKINSLEISFNAELNRITGFDQLFSENNHIPGSVKVINNGKLESVQFLFGLESTGSSLYLHHNNLLTTDGLNKLKYVGASFSLSSNQLQNLYGLFCLTSVKGMLGVAYNELVSLKGLENLSSTGLIKWSREYRSLAIQGNKVLTDVTALSGVLSTTGTLVINLDARNKYQFPPHTDAELYQQKIQLISGKKTIRPEDAMPLYKFTPERKILFDDKWTNTLGKYDWMEPFFFSFKSPEKFVYYARSHGVDYIFGQVVKSQKFLNKNKAFLQDNGLRFLETSEKFIDICFDKEKFYQYMTDNNMSDYIPAVYSGVEHAQFPAIIKKPIGNNGGDMAIINSKEEYFSTGIDGVLTEFIAGDTEYASNIIFYQGKILFDKTYIRTFNSDQFILKATDLGDIVLSTEITETPCKDIFQQILSSMSDQLIVCCFDYKLKDGRPRIFEINTRVGFTLAKDSESFKEAVDIYCQLVDEHGASS